MGRSGGIGTTRRCLVFVSLKASYCPVELFLEDFSEAVAIVACVKYEPRQSEWRGCINSHPAMLKISAVQPILTELEAMGERLKLGIEQNDEVCLPLVCGPPVLLSRERPSHH